MKLINKTYKFLKIYIQMFNNVNKTQVLQHKFKNVKITHNDLNNKDLLTLDT